MRVILNLNGYMTKGSLVEIREGRATVVIDGYEASDTFPIQYLEAAGSWIDESEKNH